MRTRSNLWPRSRPWPHLVLLSMAVVFTGCPDKKEQESPASGTATTAAPPRPPEELFSSLKCRNCHGEGSMFAAALVNARSKPDETVAMWILDAQKVRPGTGMPSFVGLMSTQEALSLARWIKAGNPVAAPAEP
ncbi:c-type cytochrome [Melittangium boletus]|uniref:Cytochrome c n=1 Tax=Melittangium boletus DSM 14713 TaxID=1294270 RepID=A0A250ITX9_9BACT|nr:cytochrome c [Melittangium boletus]ATB34386.1 cytochrome c [Melittangium boletus DSM 14713]